MFNKTDKYESTGTYIHDVIFFKAFIYYKFIIIMIVTGIPAPSGTSYIQRLVQCTVSATFIVHTVMQ